MIATTARAQPLVVFCAADPNPLGRRPTGNLPQRPPQWRRPPPFPAEIVKRALEGGFARLKVEFTLLPRLSLWLHPIEAAMHSAAASMVDMGTLSASCRGNRRRRLRLEGRSYALCQIA